MYLNFCSRRDKQTTFSGQNYWQDNWQYVFLHELFAFWVFAWFFDVCLFFSKLTFLKNSFKNTIRVSNGSDPAPVLGFFRPDMGPIGLHRLSADDKSDASSREKVKYYVLLLISCTLNYLDKQSKINSFLARGDFCLLINLVKSSDPDHAWLNVGPQMSSKLFDTLMVLLK